jgi:hypothetical protein
MELRRGQIDALPLSSTTVPDASRRTMTYGVWRTAPGVVTPGILGR